MSYKVLFSSRSLPATQFGDTYDGVSRDWARWCERMEVLPFILPNSVALVAGVVRELNPDYVVLTGGNNISPSRYNSEQAELSDISIERDETEWALVDLAVKRGIPILGICRGMQLLNVYFGGTLTPSDEAVHAGTQHRVELHLPPGLQGFPEPTVTVNSYHRHAVTEESLAPPLKAFARTSDRVVEALYHPKMPVLGLQWHPERNSPSAEFDHFVISRVGSTH